MLVWKLKEITHYLYILIIIITHITSKKYNRIIKRLTIFQRVISKESTTLVLKPLKRIYRKKVYLTDTLGDKGKKANFWKTCKSFYLLHGN